MLGGGVDAATLVAALGAGPPPPECRWGRRPHRGVFSHDDLGLRITPPPPPTHPCTMMNLKNDFLLKGKNLLIPAAAGFFSLDATSGLLATASASAPAMFLALRSALLCVCMT